MRFRTWLEANVPVPAIINNAVNNAHRKVLQQLGPVMIKIRPEANTSALQFLQQLLPANQIQEVPGVNNLNNISIDGTYVVNFNAPQPIIQAQQQTAIATNQ